MKLSNLADVLRDAGLTVVETSGWADRGYAGQDLQDVRGVLWHHTATHRSRYDTSDAPTLGMCINGRSDLPGPLCNIVFGRTGVVYLVAAGVANHAGAGSAHNIPTDRGNHYLIGIEMESSGIAPWDWTAEQLWVAPFLGAALERAYGVDLQIAHYEYSSQGKIDPAGWPGGMDGLRASINAALTGSLSYAGTITPVQEDDMPSANEIAQAILDFRVNQVGAGQSGQINLGSLLAEYRHNNNTIVENTSAWIMPEVVALRELVKQLSVQQGVTIDYEAIAKAVNDDAAKRMVK